MKTVHDQVREALRETARDSAACARPNNGGEYNYARMLADHITPEGAAKLRALLK